MRAYTCKRRDRRAAHIVYTGDNEALIREFTGLNCIRYNGCLMLRDTEGSLVNTMRVGAVALYGEDGWLRVLTADEFHSKYEEIGDRA